VDANGEVNPTDALHILNAIARHGAVDTAAYDAVYGTGALLERPAEKVEGMRHFDVNNDGKIGPHDALLVLNRLGGNQ
jgi:hypothetical protein